MAVSDEESSKPAVTHYRVIKKFNNYTHIRLEIETGRTHQIRVHMQHINHPIFADKLYAPSRLANNLISNFPRQALHAKELKFHHPVNGKELHLICELPEDLQYVLELLNKQHSI
jgi:23S rRNA pseudouridine1911/1915/1917 synthase